MNKLITILIVLCLSSCQLYNKTSSIDTTVYKNGNIKSSLVAKSKKSKEFELHEHYTRWDKEYTVYFENGKVQSVSIQKYKHATYGWPCREIVNIYKEYYSDGQLKHVQKDKCDCKTSVVKEYNDKGKLIVKKKSHQKRIK